MPSLRSESRRLERIAKMQEKAKAEVA